MSEYRMKEILDEAHQQRERAERAEAECERLTRWIKWYLDQFDEQDWTTEDQMLLEAVREGPPPPEGGPKDRLARIERACLIRNEVKAPEWAEKWSRTYDGRTIWVGVDIDESSAREVKRTAGAPDLRPSDSDPITLPIIDAPHTPEQAHGDALADAISICEGVPAQDAYIAGKKRAVWGRWVDADALLPLLRQALTASGVPELKKERLWGICMAYEKGVCVGADGTDLPDPYPEGSNDSHAYQYGLQVGRENRENRIAAAPTDGRGP